MSNLGQNQFDYDTFKQAYDANPALQNIVHRFDQDGVELKGKHLPADKMSSDDKGNTVSQMAKRATKSAMNKS